MPCSYFFLGFFCCGCLYAFCCGRGVMTGSILLPEEICVGTMRSSFLTLFTPTPLPSDSALRSAFIVSMVGLKPLNDLLPGVNLSKRMLSSNVITLHTQNDSDSSRDNKLYCVFVFVREIRYCEIYFELSSLRTQCDSFAFLCCSASIFFLSCSSFGLCMNFIFRTLSEICSFSFLILTVLV